MKKKESTYICLKCGSCETTKPCSVVRCKWCLQKMKEYNSGVITK